MAAKPRGRLFPLEHRKKKKKEKCLQGWLGKSAVDFPGNVQGDAVIAMETSHYNSTKREERS